MEVYATIFMIFVSQVLSSFTQTLPSWHKDGRHIPLPKIRRMVYFKNHNNDQESRWDTALERTSGNRENITNWDSGPNSQYEADKIVRAKIPGINSRREPVHLNDYTAFVSESGKKQRKKRSDTRNQNVFSSIVTTERSFKKPTDNTQVMVKELGKDKAGNIPLVQSSTTEAWANRAKLKFITVRPWNQFCLTCNTPNDLKDNFFRSFRIRFTKRKKTNTPRFQSMKSTFAPQQPWLFNADLVKPSNPTVKYTTKATVCENKLRTPYVNLERNNDNGNFIMKPRKKKINYFLPSLSQLGILKTSRKRYKKDIYNNIFPLTTHKLTSVGINISGNEKSISLCKNFFQNELLSKMNKLEKRSFKLMKNKKKSDLLQLFSFWQRNKCHMDRGIPPCQKACSYNLSALVNAQTIVPSDYFLRKPMLLMCCEDELGDSYTTLPIVTTSGIANTTDSPLPGDLDMSGSSSYSSDSSSVTSDSSSDMSGLSSITEDSSDSIGGQQSSTGPPHDINSSPDNSMRMLMRLQTTSTKTTVTAKSKEQFNLKMVLKNKDLNGVKLGSEFNNIPKLSYRLISFKGNDTFDENSNRIQMMKAGSPKKTQPWNKFCPCPGGEPSNISNAESGLNRQPWFSQCFSCVSTIDDNSGNSVLPDDPVSTGQSRESNMPIVHRTLEEEFLESLLTNNQTRPFNKTLLLFRVPINGTQQSSRNGSWQLVSPFNKTHNTKNVKSRSIIDLFLPSSLKRTSVRPVEHIMKPWEEPWKFREEFNLFTNSDCAMYVSDKNIKNPCATTNGPPFISKSLSQYIAETCPSCGKYKTDLLFKPTDKYDEIETSDPLYYEDDDSDNPTSNEVPEEKSDLKCLSYILKLPDVDLIKISPPVPKRFKSLKGLAILQSHDSPPKYFIEIPELCTDSENITEDTRSSRPPPVSLEKKCKKLRLEKLRGERRKNPIILCLQPFDINGNNVYLPLDIPDIGKPSATAYTTQTVSYDRKEQNSYPRSKTFANGFLDKNDSLLPFVLVPAYLAMHSDTSPPNHLLSETDFPTSANGNRNPLLFGISGDSYNKIVDKDVKLPHLLNNLPVQKKMNKVFKQLNYTLPMRDAGKVANHVGLTTKPFIKLLSSKSSVAPSRQSYIILLNGIADVPFLGDSNFPFNKGDLTFVEQKDVVTIGPLEDYILS